MAQLPSLTLLLVAVFYTLPSALDAQGGHQLPPDQQFPPPHPLPPSHPLPPVDPMPPSYPEPPQQPIGTTCPSGSFPVSGPIRRCGSSSRSRRLSHRCPGRSFCAPDSADGSGVCCERPEKCRPVIAARCGRRWDQCNSDSDCSGSGHGGRGGRGDRGDRGDRGGRRGRWGRGGKCCPGPCGRKCQGKYSGRRRGGRD